MTSRVPAAQCAPVSALSELASNALAIGIEVRSRRLCRRIESMVRSPAGVTPPWRRRSHHQ